MGKVLRITLVLVGLCLCASGPSHAARPEGGMPSFTGDWHPVMGSGGAYLVEASGRPPMTWEISVVGQEGGGYWVEMYLPEQQTIMKSLTGRHDVLRMIMKRAGQPAIEIDMQAPGALAAAAPQPQTDVKSAGQYLGQEQVTTPAGTFTCDHYRVAAHNQSSDVWITTEISPYSLVKMSSPAMTMTLQRVIKGATTRITETPQQFQMPHMPAGMEGLLNGIPGAGAVSGGRARSSSAAQQAPDMSALMQALQQQQ